MIPMTRLLAATDLSSPARQAADRGARLARESGGRLRLVHALDDGMMGQLQQLLEPGSALDGTLIEQARGELATLARELTATHGVPVDSSLVQGVVQDEIAREAAALPADLVVLGSRGAGFLRRFVLGSTAERLLRKSQQPMLVVKQRAHEAYRRVLVAVDFSPWSAPLIGLARRVAPGAQIVLLTAYEVPFESKLHFASVAGSTIQTYHARVRQLAVQQLHALAAGAGLASSDWTPCIRRADASLAIVEQEQEQACDLIVIGKHGRSRVEDLLLGSVTSHVLAESAGDVLVSTSTAAA
jgi:nucleotide-binding universal stress UspA family protein